jgi:hypothetical protein
MTNSKYLLGLGTGKQISPYRAILNRIEALTAQHQLDCLGESMKEKYKKVFLPLLHIDDPT